MVLELMVGGALVGFVVGATGVGGGSLMTPLLTPGFGVPAQVAVGIDSAHAVPLTLVSGLGHAALGNVDWALLGALLLGSLPAIQLGTAVAHRLSERVLRSLLAALLAALAARLLWS